MQSFLPLPSLEESARVLDVRRLAAMRKESVQLLHAVSPGVPIGTPDLLARKQLEFERGDPPKRGWSNHAAARMWRGRVPALAAYLRAVDAEWIRRGYKSNLLVPEVGEVVMPSWFGDARFHSSHRSALLRKLPDYYAAFGWTDDPAAEYYWPGPCADLPADVS